MSPKWWACGACSYPPFCSYWHPFSRRGPCLAQRHPWKASSQKLPWGTGLNSRVPTRFWKTYFPIYLGISTYKPSSIWLLGSLSFITSFTKKSVKIKNSSSIYQGLQFPVIFYFFASKLIGGNAAHLIGNFASRCLDQILNKYSPKHSMPSVCWGCPTLLSHWNLRKVSNSKWASDTLKGWMRAILQSGCPELNASISVYTSSRHNMPIWNMLCHFFKYLEP